LIPSQFTGENGSREAELKQAMAALENDNLDGITELQAASIPIVSQQY
jgi:hypothetical protein